LCSVFILFQVGRAGGMQEAVTAREL